MHSGQVLYIFVILMVIYAIYNSSSTDGMLSLSEMVDLLEKEAAYEDEE